MLTVLDRHRTKRAHTTVACFLAILALLALTTRWIDISVIRGSLQLKSELQESYTYPEDFNCSIRCSDITDAITQPAYNNPLTSKSCPDYFRWIHEDLRPWKVSGIKRKMVEKAKDSAHVRILIVKGRLYTEKYKEGFQTRDAVTIWGLLQLLRLYPGKLPDLDLMFETNDRPVVKKRDLVNKSIPPPLFHYCGDDSSYDIVFPDWSFWGWPELNIKPWNELKDDLKEGNERIPWDKREPYAYWKGNMRLGHTRQELKKCNVSNGQDWKARIFHMDWKKEKKEGFNNSDLASQCTYRYKIYAEGLSWSVSEKYILACDSMSLVIEPRYYDFFTRSLLPSIHYWPINPKNECRSVKFAVEWGNKYTDKARDIRISGSRYVQENLEMKYVYDYMFHLLNEYAKLLRYKPTIPEGAVETCSEESICSVRGQKRRFRKVSMVKSPSDSLPCALLDEDEGDIRKFLKRKEDLTNKILRLEQRGEL